MVRFISMLPYHMIRFTRFTLENGLKVIVHEDKSTPLVTMNVLYDVGSRDEDQALTGFAHLFEHLMFGGSVNIPEYDLPLQMTGAENNAFTNNDITNYYLTIPGGNIETGFWLESDRMLELNFSRKNLETQKNVVIEEYKQRYLNQPYGDAILLLRPLAYKVHPYRWSTIGIDISHIENATLSQVKRFFYAHYAPNNAVLCLSGNIEPGSARKLSEKWFGPIEKRKISPRLIPSEPKQQEARKLTVERDVPANAIYKVWHSTGRMNPDFKTLDLLTDILSGGESGRLSNRLVREQKLFSDINAYVTSDIDPGLLIIQGNLMKGVGFDTAENAIEEIIKSLRTSDKTIGDEIEKVKNRYESTTVFSNTSILNKAVNLSFYELLGDAGLVNREVEEYRSVTADMVEAAAGRYLVPENSSTLYYKSIR